MEEIIEKTNKTKKKNKNVTTATQKDIAREIAKELNTTIDFVEKVIDLEQRKTMERIKDGHSVVKKNYLTMRPYQTKERTMHSALNGKDYVIESRTSVRVTVGDGFLSFISSNRPMKDKLCRFVDKKTN